MFIHSVIPNNGISFMPMDMIKDGGMRSKEH